MTKQQQQQQKEENIPQRMATVPYKKGRKAWHDRLYIYIAIRGFSSESPDFFLLSVPCGINPATLPMAMPRQVSP